MAKRIQQPAFDESWLFRNDCRYRDIDTVATRVLSYSGEYKVVVHRIRDYVGVYTRGIVQGVQL